MGSWLETLMTVVILTNLLLLASSRLGGCIRFVQWQGIALGLLPLFTHGGHLSLRIALLSIGTLAIKAVIFPWLLGRTLREVRVRREVEPFVGYTSSIGMGMMALLLSVWLSERLPLPAEIVSPLAVPVAFFTIFSGLFLIVSRRKAFTQVIGYLVLENGIYVFGAALVHGEPLLIELGILLDALVAVFVFGIAIHHISQEFDSIDVGNIADLKD